jgi:hypothetical protein
LRFRCLPVAGDPKVTPTGCLGFAARGVSRWGWRVDKPRRTVSRRAFIGAAGLAVGTAASGPTIFHDLLTASEQAGLEPFTPTGPADIVLTVERAEDLVLLDFAFYGFKIVAGKPPKITPTTADNAIVVFFPPQAIGEAAYFESGGSMPVDPPPVLSVMAGRSRLCFTLTTTMRIPLPTMTPADLLDWHGWSLAVAPGAQANATPPLQLPKAPDGFSCAVEAPFALLLSPVVDVGTPKHLTQHMIGPTHPLTVDNVTSVWSSRLAAVKGGHPTTPLISAVWSRDYTNAAGGTPNLTPPNHIHYSAT